MKGQPERVDSWPMSLGRDWGVLAFCLIAPISEVRGIKILLLRREGHLGTGGGNGNWSSFLFPVVSDGSRGTQSFGSWGQKAGGWCGDRL